MTLHDYHLYMKEAHPATAELLDTERLAATEHERWLVEGNEFDDDETGRGGSYRRAQAQGEARRTGITELFRMLGGPDAAGMGTVLDVLGGEGLLSRVWRDLRGVPATAPVPLITGDISGGMVAAALRGGLPAVRQRADRLLLRDGTMNGVLVGYGTHHIPRAQRPAMAAEAWRVLAPGGRLVVHDFAEGSPVARWFGEVVHPWSRAGHDYDHFTRDELTSLLTRAGFEEVTVEEMYDPVILTADTGESALAALVSYMTSMYGLEPASPGREPAAAVERALREVFTYPASTLPASAVPEVTVRADGPRFRAELPRVALVARGHKP
ncbi:methyltransferase domain-containing protein [Streptomyces sedi]|uniref:Methyltransferase domain-containing protein n=2 Tax=Streptomyces sedi TaxID=555059 RepID=A0A5C4UX56_9ACTN|nr:methyltransferase domain-containing protein [Streptomyces sedi]